MSYPIDVNTATRTMDRPTEKAVSLKRWGRKLKQRLRGIPQVVGYRFKDGQNPTWEGLTNPHTGHLDGVACQFQVFFDKAPDTPVDVTFIIPSRSDHPVDQLLAQTLKHVLVLGGVQVDGEPIPPLGGSSPTILSSTPTSRDPTSDTIVTNGPPNSPQKG